ncbi:MAG: amidohydrolase [Bacteroidetes bacterium]|nr:amidohydrolase [Bacteroidota bacterium]
MEKNAVFQRIQTLSSKYYDEIRDVRRHLHKNPELSCQEINTAKFVADYLRKIGIDCQENIGGYGVVGLVASKTNNKQAIALRTDMDALPINEESSHDYCSTNAGVMHACGHDVHIACLLGAAKILNDLRDELSVSVKLLFQPSEETFPGGAIAMIRDGVMKNPEVKAVYGLHVDPAFDAGMIGAKSGMYMASTDEIYITINGKGGHAAMPDLLNDPVFAASQIVVNLQQLVSRNMPPHIPCVLSFGRLIADGRTNIIPDQVEVAGTLRTFSEIWREKMQKRIHDVAEETAKACQVEAVVRVAKGYPALINNSDAVAHLKSTGVALLGAENVLDLDLRMTAEDFSYFANEAPSCFFRLGVRNESAGIIHNLHTSRFDVDENALKTGMAIMAGVVV